jgi:hypothetical protein
MADLEQGDIITELNHDIGRALKDNYIKKLRELASGHPIYQMITYWCACIGIILTSMASISSFSSELWKELHLSYASGSLGLFAILVFCIALHSQGQVNRGQRDLYIHLTDHYQLIHDVIRDPIEAKKRMTKGMSDLDDLLKYADEITKT